MQYHTHTRTTKSVPRGSIKNSLKNDAPLPHNLQPNKSTAILQPPSTYHKYYGQSYGPNLANKIMEKITQRNSVITNQIYQKFSKGFISKRTTTRTSPIRGFNGYLSQISANPLKDKDFSSLGLSNLNISKLSNP